MVLKVMNDRNTIPPTLSELLVKLGYLASIPNQKKVCFNDLSYVNAKAWTGAYKRFSEGESRKNMLDQVEQIINKAIEEIDRYTGTQYLQLLVDNLSSTEVGINNLINTYRSDPNVVLRLEVIKTKIGIKLKPFRKLTDSIGPTTSIASTTPTDKTENDDVEF